MIYEVKIKSVEMLKKFVAMAETFEAPIEVWNENGGQVACAKSLIHVIGVINFDEPIRCRIVDPSDNERYKFNVKIEMFE